MPDTVHAASRQKFPRITPEALEELEARVGSRIPPRQPHVEEVTRDAVRHWVYGIGDINPLFQDEDYAGASAVGGLVASPTFVFPLSRILSGYVGGLPGVHGMFAGADITWHRWLRVGERPTTEAFLDRVVERKSRFAGRSIEQVHRIEFRDGDGDLIAEARMSGFRTERNTAQEKGKYKDVQLKTWEDDELEDIYEAYRREEVRGEEPRTIDTVSVGDELPHIVRGPYTPTMAIAFLQGWGGLYIYAHRYAVDLFDRHPGLAIRNPQGVLEPPERVHWDPDMARAAGVPAPYDYGPERVAWFGSLLTNWIGDAGFLRRLNVQVRRHNLMGEVVWCTGTVRSVERLDTVGSVTIDLLGTTHDGEMSVKGEALVELPL